jgi:hypothetical protein
MRTISASTLNQCKDAAASCQNHGDIAAPRGGFFFLLRFHGMCSRQSLILHSIQLTFRGVALTGRLILHWTQIFPLMVALKAALPP